MTSLKSLAVLTLSIVALSIATWIAIEDAQPRDLYVGAGAAVSGPTDSDGPEARPDGPALEPPPIDDQPFTHT